MYMYIGSFYTCNVAHVHECAICTGWSTIICTGHHAIMLRLCITMLLCLPSLLYHICTCTMAHLCTRHISSSVACLACSEKETLILKHTHTPHTHTTHTHTHTYTHIHTCTCTTHKHTDGRVCLVDSIP